jgi:hypothetical protein
MMMSKPTKRVRCAVYTRVSTEYGLDQEFNSLDAQHEAAEAYIRSQAHDGWTLIRTRYDDGGYSGGSTDRPALQRLQADTRSPRSARSSSGSDARGAPARRRCRKSWVYTRCRRRRPPLVRWADQGRPLMPGKRVQFDDETWHALDLLARDRMQDFQELADEAFRDLLRSTGGPPT